MTVRPVLVLDSASLYYRSFHALPESMTAPDGRPHNAVRGFLSTIARLVASHAPTEVIACWDDDWRPAWRVQLIASYKAHRVGDPATGAELEPDTLGPQATAIAELLDALGLVRIGVPGFEADDVIGSLAAREPRPVIVVSGDRDLVQVVDDTTRLLLTVNGGMDKWPLLDPDGVRERFGVSPDRYVDLAVLRGDPSDGLPGVPGIGAKTAEALVTAFGGLDRILRAAVDEPTRRPMTPRLAGLLVGHEDTVRRARQVALVRTDLDVLGRSGRPDPERAAQLVEQWGVERQVAELARVLGAHTADE